MKIASCALASTGGNVATKNSGSSTSGHRKLSEFKVSFWILGCGRTPMNVHNDPVNFIDPWGLFRFGTRPLDGVPVKVENVVDDYFNTEIAHEQSFFEDGTGDNIGFFGDNQVRSDHGHTIDEYELEDYSYNDGLMRDAVKNVGRPGD